MNIPDSLPTLHNGSHEEGSKQLCAMEAAAWLAAEPHSDRPACVHPVLAEMARAVNDSVDDESRQEMWPLIIRCLGTASDDKVLSVRLAIFCAQRVLSIYEGKYPDDDRPRKAIAAAQAWADNPCKQTAANAAAAAAYAAAAYAAATATYAAAAAARSSANAAYAAAAATYAAAAARSSAAAAYAAAAATRIQILTDILDEYDRITGRTTYEQPTDDAWDRVLVAGRD